MCFWRQCVYLMTCVNLCNTYIHTHAHMHTHTHKNRKNISPVAHKKVFPMLVKMVSIAIIFLNPTVKYFSWCRSGMQSQDNRIYNSCSFTILLKLFNFIHEKWLDWRNNVHISNDVDFFPNIIYMMRNEIQLLARWNMILNHLFSQRRRKFVFMPREESTELCVYIVVLLSQVPII